MSQKSREKSAREKIKKRGGGCFFILGRARVWRAKYRAAASGEVVEAARARAKLGAMITIIIIIIIISAEHPPTTPKAASRKESHTCVRACVCVYVQRAV